MNLPANLPDASSLAATVERARALLDEGDVIAARVLAAHAYDEAKSALRWAERLYAGQNLVEKARRLQGDALLIEARVKIVLADEWDAAKDAGLVSKGGRPREKPLDDDKGFSAADAGLTHSEIHEARKLRDAEAREPGIVERAIAARLEAGLNPSRANLRAAIGTDSRSKDARGLNFYETPVEAMRVLLALEDFSPLVWEPACGRGAISAQLEAAGYDVFNSDIVDRGCVDRHGELQAVMDFLQTPFGMPDGKARDIVTNPPYGESLNAFVAHALRVHKPRKMALLLNSIFMFGTEDPDRVFAMEEQPPTKVIRLTRRLPMMHQDGWDGNKASSRMNTCWFVWERRENGTYGAQTILEGADWKDFEERAPKPPAAPPAAKPKRARKVKADA